MKRDWELIRRIMLAAESAAPGQKLSASAFPGEDAGALFEHVRLLKEVGMLDAAVRPSFTGAGGGAFVIHRLLWTGFDALDQWKSDTWWNKVKSMAQEKGMSITFELLADLAKPTGLKLLGMLGS